MAIIPVTDPADPRIAAYRDIQERDLVGRGDRFVAEGKVTLGVLLSRSPHTVESILIGENRTGPLRDTLAQVPEAVPIFAASREVLDAIVGFHLHRGVLAIGRRALRRRVSAILQPGSAPSTVLALMELSNHDNVGACFRNAAALGADAVLLDATCADPLYRKAIRVSAGTTLWMPTGHAASPQEMIAAIGAAGYTPLALTPARHAFDLYDMEIPERTCLIVGAEGPGLPESVLETCLTARLPMANDVDSLNVATAAAIALSWVQRQRRIRS